MKNIGINVFVPGRLTMTPVFFLLFNNLTRMAKRRMIRPSIGEMSKKRKEKIGKEFCHNDVKHSWKFACLKGRRGEK